MLSLLISLLPLAQAQVTATGPNGPTNPSAPSFYSVGSTVNQQSMSRLISLNGVDDFCLWGPPDAGPNNQIGNEEAVVVAWCTKPRNGARLIPDGTIQSAHFVRTPLYVQVSGMWDGTKVNIPAGDYGGELDPHGATGEGNPIGGNVTSDVTGKDVFYEEWMSFVAATEYCFRICTAQNATISAALECEHELDLMGCQFVMAIGDFYDSGNTFTSCDGDAAYPPGVYPLANGSSSTFRQKFSGVYTDGSGSVVSYTVGQDITPSAPYDYPATSNCITYSSISNGINTNNYQVTASVSTISNSPYSANPGAASTSGSSSTSTSASKSSSSGSASGSTSGSSGSGSASASKASGAASSAAAAHVLAAQLGPGFMAVVTMTIGLLLGAVVLV